MDGGESHRSVEGLVLERKALRGGGHARRCVCGTLRPHERRRFHRGYVAVGGLVGAGARPDIQHCPRIAERSPDPRGDPWLGTPRHIDAFESVGKHVGTVGTNLCHRPPEKGGFTRTFLERTTGFEPATLTLAR